jgi:glycosyl hydrolase family 20
MRKVRSASIAGVLTLIALSTSLLGIHLGAPQGASLNPRLEVVPTLREWHASAGYFRFHVGSRIVIDSADAISLIPTAKAIQEDLASLTGARLMIAQGSYEMPGDVFVSLHANDDEIGTEGYLFEIGDSVTIRAHTPAGVFYGSRSLMQMLTAGHSFFLPRGKSRDFPQYSERGFMLDVSSQFVSTSLLKRYVRYLSWFKFNDLQLELNDNGGFRLNSPAFAGLAAKDGSYTETQFKDLETYALVRGITITPEIDSPGHAAALTNYRPDLADPKNANFMDVRNPRVYSFMATLWGAFLPWFTGSGIAIGADEYDTADGDGYRAYVNFLDAFLRQQGKSVRMWGSLSREPGLLPVRTDITIQQWDTEWSNPMTMDRLGFPIINASSEFLYIVIPKSPWFADHIDAPNLYRSWNPSKFSRSDQALNLSPGDPRLRGAMFDFWGYAASQDAFTRVRAGMPVVGEKLWNDVSGDVPYPIFQSAGESAGEVL